jgi:hypothetical protein
LWIGRVEPVCSEDWKCQVGSAARPVQLPAGRHYLGREAVGHHPGQVAVRGRHKAHVHLDGPGAAQAFELLLLQHAEQLGCNSCGMSPTSSRKSVPGCASSKRPILCMMAPVKAPFSWPSGFQTLPDQFSSDADSTRLWRGGTSSAIIEVAEAFKMCC